MEQHVAKKTCQKRQKEAVEQGVTPSEFPSPPPSKLFAISQGAASLNSQHRALLFFESQGAASLNSQHRALLFFESQGAASLNFQHRALLFFESQGAVSFNFQNRALLFSSILKAQLQSSFLAQGVAFFFEF